MGGTRFVGKPLVSRLLHQGHQLTLFTRGRQPVPEGVEAVNGDRGDDSALDQLKGRQFDVIVDSSGRTLRTVNACWNAPVRLPIVFFMSVQRVCIPGATSGL